MQVGALFAYPSVQCTGRFFAVVRTLLPVRIAELLFCVLKCARSSFRRALRNAMTAKAHQMHAISTI